LQIEKDLEEGRLKKIEQELGKPFNRDHFSGIRKSHIASTEYESVGIETETRIFKAKKIVGF